MRGGLEVAIFTLVASMSLFAMYQVGISVGAEKADRSKDNISIDGWEFERSELKLVGPIDKMPWYGNPAWRWSFTIVLGGSVIYIEKKTEAEIKEIHTKYINVKRGW